MYRVNGHGHAYKTAHECAVAHFGTEAVVSLPFDMWMSTSSGETITILRG